jgi:transposase
MLTPETLLQLQKYNFDLLARQEPSGRRRLRYIALAHIKDGKSPTETALVLRVTPRAVTRWLKWFIDEGLDRVAGIPHYWSTQRLPIAQEEAFRQAVEQLQHRRGGGRVRGEDVRQLLAQQFGVDYTLNGVYELLKRLDMAWISARSVSPNANPARQAEFKKTWSKRYRPFCRLKSGWSRSMCGFRTKCALASAVPRRGSGRAKEHGRASCGSSNPNRPISLVPCARNGMRLSAWYCRTPIPRPWRFTCRKSAKQFPRGGMPW